MYLHVFPRPGAEVLPDLYRGLRQSPRGGRVHTLRRGHSEGLGVHGAVLHPMCRWEVQPCKRRKFVHRVCSSLQLCYL